MKTELRLAKHSVLPGHNVIEIWWMDRLIGQVTGADGPGVRILSKHTLKASIVSAERTAPDASIAVWTSPVSIIEVGVIE